MRKILWNPQERVDQPELTAITELLLGEFRRHVRGLLIGGSTDTFENFLVKGFKVVASSPADSLITVRLLPTGATPLSFAIGKEDLGAYKDAGALIGGRGITGDLEGNASMTFDFDPHPNGVYGVYIRFVYSDGAQDNRAFWNSVANSEFIANVDTRRLPTIELDVNQVGDDWIKLADVTWGGSTVTTGNIADARTFVFEGTNGIFPDFNRNPNRRDNGINEIYPVLRALGRQIQDLKGPVNAAGNRNWYEATGLVCDPAEELGENMSIWSCKDVHFTVGDGIDTFGDFNGTSLGSGLDACLTHIETFTSATDFPFRAKITLLDYNRAEWEIDNHVIPGGITVEIVGVGGATLTGSGRVRITMLGSASSPALSGRLSLKNLEFVSDVGLRAGLLASIYCHLDNCSISCGTQTNASAVYSLRAFNANVDIRNCSISGRVKIDGTVVGRVANTDFSLCGLTVDSIAPGATVAYGLTFSECRFNPNGLNYSIDTAPSGTVRIATSSSIAFENCDFKGGGSLDMVRIYTTSSAVEAQNISFRSCKFTHTTTPTHAADAGTGGIYGTGWAIFADGDFTSNLRIQGLVIDGCFFDGNMALGTFSKDAGAISLFECEGPVVTNCSFIQYMTSTVAADRVRLIQITASAANRAVGALIHGNTFSRWALPSVSSTLRNTAIYVRYGADIRITANHIKNNGAVVAEAEITDLIGAAISINASRQVLVADNKVWRWTGDGVAVIVDIFDSDNCTISRNGFTGGNGFGISILSSNYTQVEHNSFEDDASGVLGGITIDDAVDYTTVIGNIFKFSVLTNAVAAGASEHLTVIGNQGPFTQISSSDSTGRIGYNTTPQMNNITSWV